MEYIPLKSSAHGFQSVFDAWPSPAATLDCALTITSCNAAFEAATQRPRALLQGRMWREVFTGSEQQASALARSFRRVLRTGKPHYLPDFRSGSLHAGPQQPGRTWAVSNIPLMSQTGEVVGVLHCPIDVTSVARKSAPQRMARAGRKGRAPALCDMQSILKEAIRDDRIVLYGQRIFPLNDGANEATRSFEVLSRLRDLDGTLIPPAGFIPAAERFGLIEELDRHIIATAFAHLAGLDSKTRNSVCYFLNLSGVTLSSASFPGFIERLLTAHPDVLASQICFEVTETAALSDTRRSADAMRRLSSYGFRFALDDFGSGMASFSYLQQLPVKYVKIDGEFIKDILTNPANAIIVEAVAKLAKCMNIQAVAECIESCELLPVLRSLGIEYGQGFALRAPEDLDMAVTRASPGLRVPHKGVRSETGGVVLDLRKRTRRRRVVSASAGHPAPQNVG